jgi:hypothetical protein
MANDKLTNALEWAMTALQQTEINTEIVVQTPWSSVVRISTGDELFYLKTTPALIALESEIIKILHDQFRAPVPTLISVRCLIVLPSICFGFSNNTVKLMKNEFFAN